MTAYGGLAGRYVKPLFDVAWEKGEVERISDDLAALDEALRKSPDLRGLLNDPSVARSAKRSVVESVFRDASPFALNFIRVVIDKNRTEILDVAYPIFRDLIDESRGVMTGVVETAVPLDEATFEKVKTGLESRFASRLELERRVVPDLIGGLRVRVGNTVIDGSVKGRLTKLQGELAGM